MDFTINTQTTGDSINEDIEYSVYKPTVISIKKLKRNLSNKTKY